LSKIILKGFITVPNSEIITVKEALPLHIKLTQQEKGCLVFKVMEDKLNKNIFNVYEEFTSKQSFEAHQNRVQGSEWGRLTKYCDRHYQIIEE